MLFLLSFTLSVAVIDLTKRNVFLEDELSQVVVSPEINDKDVKWLALNIYHEARGESLNGMLAVGAVTLNRVKSPDYPSTIEEVVKQKRQFSWYNDGNDKEIYDEKSWKVSKNVAKILLTKRDLEIFKKINGALYYHSKEVNPYWVKRMEKVIVIGNHIFYM